MTVSEQERIARIRRRYQTGPAVLSVERARYYTRSWQRTASGSLARPVRVALAMQEVYENMTLHVDPDDRIAGAWTEHFLGMPIDIERGVFNRVLEAELTLGSMVLHRARTLGRALLYMARKGSITGFIRNQIIARRGGTSPLNLGLETMSRRPINPFVIDETDRLELVETLLPYWNGRSLTDRLEREMERSGLLSEDMHAFATALAGSTSRQVLMVSTCATIATLQGHVILDFPQVLKKGLRAMQAEVRAEASGARPRSSGERDFLKSLDLALEGVMTFCARLANRIQEEAAFQADAGRRAELEEMLAVCRKVPLEPAETLREAVQAIWSLKTAVELAHPVNLHCFGRLDQDLYPYYRADRDAGRIADDQAEVLLQELLLKMMSQNMRPESNLLGNYYHRFLGSVPLTLGGLTPDGRDGTNGLTRILVDAAHHCRAVTNVSVRVTEETPDDLLDRIGRYLADGTSSFSLFNDPLMVRAMEKRGFALSDARNYAIMGCVEATCPGKTGSMSANALLLSRLLDITLRNGDSALMAGTVRNEGIRTGEPSSFGTFDQLLAAFQQQADFFLDKIVEASNLRDRLYAEWLPAPYISAFIEGCLENRRDVTRGGARYDLSGISMINGLANLVDSLHVIQKLVFDENRFTLDALVRATDRDFAGCEDILRAIRTLESRWGNGYPETDALARRVLGGLFDRTYRYRSFKGGPFVTYLISMITHTIDGRLSIATPDGRRAGRPYAASCNPYNVERFGVTAVLRSVAALPFEDVLGSATNVKFHPSAIGRNEQTRAKWISLIRTYFRMGGAQIQPTAVSALMLKQAQAHPDEHRDLIVKVGGYSTYFVDLGTEIQREIIKRTEHVPA